MNGIFLFKVKKGNDEGIWVVDVKNGKGSVKFDANGTHVCIYAANINLREKQAMVVYKTGPLVLSE